MKYLLVIVAFAALVIGVRRSNWKPSWRRNLNRPATGNSEAQR